MAPRRSDRPRFGSSGPLDCRRLVQGCARTLQSLDERCLAPHWPGEREPSPPYDPTALELQRRVAALRGALRTSNRPEVVAALAVIVDRIASQGERFKESIIRLGELVDSLCTAAQIAFGSTASGRDKHEAVKASVIHYIRRSDIHLPRIPDFVEPAVFELVVGSFVAVIYRVSRNQPGWRAHAGRAVHGWAIRRWLSRLFVRLSTWAANLAWRLTLRMNPIPPALDRHITEMIVNQPEHRAILVATMEQLSSLAPLFVESREGLTELVDVLIVVVREVRLWEGLDDERRYALARDVMVELLVEERIIAPSGLSRPLWEASIGLAVELLSRLLDRRRWITPPSSSPVALPPAQAE
jgi:hypothetical protein